MNIQDYDVLNALMTEPFINQRILAETCGHSLGVVNRALHSLQDAGYLDDGLHPTADAAARLKQTAPQRAVILAAGFGMRMVPINMETAKGLLEVHGEPLIERTIRQLHEAGIREIYVVVGFMKERFEYLIDEYGVQLIVNPEYAAKNNLHSLKYAVDYLTNSYIIPCDIWCDRNPYRAFELYSWYMVSDLVDNDSTVRVNRRMELTLVSDHSGGNEMIGIAYLTADTAAVVRARILQLVGDARYDDSFWEDALYGKDRMIVNARVVHASNVVEINTYEQLRELDSGSNQLQSAAIETAARALNAVPTEITDITVLKKGMTNRSFLFCCKGRKYIMRIPGEGTDQLINRRQEADVYQTIRDQNLCDHIVYINPDNGYKITEYLNNARVCNPNSPDDVQQCMHRLRAFHEKRLHVNHTFDIFGQLDFYEQLWHGAPSAYKDYARTRENVMRLRPYIAAHCHEPVLTHIDAVPDNFLFVPRADGSADIRLIDWEYAGMQDPYVDIAMFCIYAMYDRDQVERTIDAYFPEGCPAETRTLIYCYIAACGLLWSNWCEYKRSLGVEFGEYSIRQYRYAKEYFKLAQFAQNGEAR